MDKLCPSCGITRPRDPDHWRRAPSGAWSWECRECLRARDRRRHVTRTASGYFAAYRKARLATPAGKLRQRLNWHRMRARRTAGTPDEPVYREVVAGIEAELRALAAAAK